MTELATDRLRLRQWRAGDFAPFAALNADPAVMEHFPAPLDRRTSDALARREQARIAERGWGLWAVEVTRVGEPVAPGESGGIDDAGADDAGAPGRSVDGESGVIPGMFIGFVGLAAVGDELPCGPAVEVGWRLARHAWGHGFASEAARAAVGHAWDAAGLDLDELVSFTALGNRRSRQVMERIGMTHHPAEDFDHPRLPGHRLERHVLYRLRRPAA